MLTEDEAKTKWCPFAFAVRGDKVSGFNRGVDMRPDVACYCIASACMAWRWGPVIETAAADPRALPAGHPATNTNVEYVGTNRFFLPAKGHCGLAGAAP